MYSVAIISSYISIWCLYAVAKKVEFTKANIVLQLSKNAIKAKLISCGLFAFSTFLLCNCIGYVAGILTALVLWMLLISLIVLFAPFQKIKYLHVFFFITMMLSLELTICYLI